jgi:N utilization substance protein B
VLQSLFEIDLAGHEPKAVLEERLSHASLPAAGHAFARRLLHGVVANRAFLDKIISRYAPEWPVEQMAAIDHNILRMALFELAAGNDTPMKVAINEAVELAKLFGSDSCPRFVNGVLGSAVASGNRLILPFPPDDAGSAAAVADLPPLESGKT